MALFMMRKTCRAQTSLPEEPTERVLPLFAVRNIWTERERTLWTIERSWPRVPPEEGDEAAGDGALGVGAGA
jgi:hypothetical protein